VIGHDIGRVGADGDRRTEQHLLQPEAVSPVNVAVARSVPLLVHKLPTCAPVFAALL